MEERVSLEEYFDKKIKEVISEKFKIPEKEITEEVLNKYLFILTKAYDWFLPEDIEKMLSQEEYEAEFKMFLVIFYPEEYDRIYG